ncbi:MAG: hypothetical protein QOE68_3386 [Thermoanaerobaculia bacterium]|nr:hypothetical protein [Thermoanaerobaculia bacterium]
MNAILIVIAPGRLGRKIADVAQAHAEFDPDSRYVLRPGDARYPATTDVERWTRAGAAALIVDGSGRVCALLDARQATSPPWIENGFLCGRNGRADISMRRAS